MQMSGAPCGTTVKIPAYAILDGGGVLGAALAGCLKAAEDYGFEFVGYGGTSAGSIVALLASVGYSGDELGKLITETPFTKFLEEDGKKLTELKKHVKTIITAVQPGWIRAVLNICQLLSAFVALRSAVDDPKKAFGVDAGTSLEAFLTEMVHAKVQLLKDAPMITFDQLEKAKCKPLKVIASDLTRRQPAIFSSENQSYGLSVIDAVRASSCYPVVFKAKVMT
ncbi:MAG: patatin-like phospholipase family protein, partial [Planctomycetota bacterium]|nr:patatin-like phospholipase family protein [Planctomycetota bacterium]